MFATERNNLSVEWAWLNVQAVNRILFSWYRDALRKLFGKSQTLYSYIIVGLESNEISNLFHFRRLFTIKTLKNKRTTISRSINSVLGTHRSRVVRLFEEN